jgi:PASTA domain
MTRARPAPAPPRRQRGLPWLLIAVVAILFILGIVGGIQALWGTDTMKGWFDFLGGNNPSPQQPAVPEKVEVPEVTGLTRSVAEHRLDVAGLEVGQVSSFPSDDVPAGRVISQGFAAGTSVEQGTQVNLDVSSGPQPVSSASSSASAPSKDETGAASASVSASTQPTRREDRPAVRRETQDDNPKIKVPKTKVQKTKVQKTPPARTPNAAAPAKEPLNDSGVHGRGRGRGRGGESGED